MLGAKEINELWYSIYLVLSTGFAVVALLLALLKLFNLIPTKLQSLIEINNTIALCIGSLACISFLFAFVSGSAQDNSVFYSRVLGKYRVYYFIQLIFPLVLPQLFWFRKMRGSVWLALVIGCSMHLFQLFEFLIRFQISMEDDSLTPRWLFCSYINWPWLASSVGIYCALMAFIYMVFYRKRAVVHVG